MKFLSIVTPMLGIVLLTACAALSRGGEERPLAVVPHVDLERYLGTWYEIARLPTWFEKDCAATTATYELKANGRIRVINRCRKGGLEGKPKEARGVARVVDPATNAKLKVRFFWPFSGDYWIIGLDEAYRWVLVGEPTRRFFWILCRTPQMDPVLYTELVERARALGFEVERLERPPQPPAGS